MGIGGHTDALACLEQVDNHVRAGVGLPGTRRPLDEQHTALEVAYHLLDGIGRRQTWIKQRRTRLNAFHPWRAAMEKVRHRLEA
ncbi:hypothetical protein D9M71_739840 [compost metagenome]